MASTLWSSVLVHRSDDGRLEILCDRSGGYGWAEQWVLAFGLAVLASQMTNKRHRVYWSANGKAWMIRRAFTFNGPDTERAIDQLAEYRGPIGERR